MTEAQEETELTPEQRITRLEQAVTGSHEMIRGMAMELHRYVQYQADTSLVINACLNVLQDVVIDQDDNLSREEFLNLLEAEHSKLAEKVQADIEQARAEAEASRQETPAQEQPETAEDELDDIEV